MADPKWLARQTLACVMGSIGMIASAVGLVIVISRIGALLHGYTVLLVGESMLVSGTLMLLATWWLLAAVDRNQPLPIHLMRQNIFRASLSISLIVLVGLIVGTALKSQLIGISALLLIPWMCVTSLVCGRMFGRACGLMNRTQHRRTRKLLPIAKWACYVLSVWPFWSMALFFFVISLKAGADIQYELLLVLPIVLAVLLGTLWLWVAWRVHIERSTAIATWVSD